MVAFGEYSDDGTASAMKARDYKDATDLVAIGAFGKDVADTVTSKFSKGAELLQQGAQNGGNCVLQPIVVDRAAFNQGENAQYKFRAEHSETMDSLVARGPHAVLQPMAYNIAPGKGGLKDDIHVTDAYATKTLDASGSNPAMHQGGAAILQPIAFSGCDDGMDTQINVTPTMRVAGNSQGNLAVAVGTDLYNGNITGDVAATMGTPGSSINASGPTVMQAMAVRRLTPVECERLQGFPDNYTDIKSKSKPTPDGPRYKALGNSMAVPVMAWIGQRIQEVEAICKQNK
jgi:site-specific DNA-cytosine methylase